MSLDNLQNSSKQTRRVAILVHKLPLCMYTYYTPIHMPIPKYIQMCFQILKPKHISIHTYTYLHIHTQPHTCIPTNTHKYTNSYMNTHQYIQIYPQELPQTYKHLSIYTPIYRITNVQTSTQIHKHIQIQTYSCLRAHIPKQTCNKSATLAYIKITAYLCLSLPLCLPSSHHTQAYKHIHAYAHTYPNKPAIRAQL